MASKKIAQFPDVEAKLQKPAKQSAFERQRAEAEAKRQREASETAAVLKDFVKSFNNDDDDDDDNNGGIQSRNMLGRSSGLGGAPPKGGMSGKRHFGTSNMKSGPGSLGQSPASFGGWKRGGDGLHDRRNRDDSRGRHAFDDYEPPSVSKAFITSDEDEDASADRAEEKAIAKPTLRLANLPPGTSPAVVRALMPSNLAVENVKINPQTGPGGTERKSTTAIVTLSKETAATDMDAAVSALQNRYLGFGFYLSLHRHLSSAAISAPLATLATSSSASQPFGARPVPQDASASGPQNTAQGRGFAPPTSYGPPGGPINRGSILHVPVKPPDDVKKLRVIHKVIEAVLQHGPEFEALLMTRSDVQKEERWSWIWDARSDGGIWYRYRLWQIITGSQTKRGQAKYLPLFDGSHAWKVPDQPLPYEYNTSVDEFVSESEYNSSDDDDYDDEPKPTEGGIDQEDTFLNPMEKAKLTHLLARLPTTLSHLRNGDIARITTFAITHASRGADEIVSMIVSNIERPLALTSANPDHRAGSKEGQRTGSRGSSPIVDEKAGTETQDSSGASLIGLYIVSDILSSSSTSGVRHAWRFRQLFESALRNRKVFEELGLMAEKLQWGRLKAEKWKRSVGLILGHWEGWCVFPAESQGFFVNSFENPPSSKKDESDEDSARKGKWKTLDNGPGNSKDSVDSELVAAESSGAGTNGHKAEDDDAGADDENEGLYVEYTDDEDVDLECLEEEDIDGEPLLESGMDGLSMGEDVTMSDAHPPSVTAAEKPDAEPQQSVPKTAPTRKRMRAVDMFADSDSEGKD
jgi:U2-associated protein SR140